MSQKIILLLAFLLLGNMIVGIWSTTNRESARTTDSDDAISLTRPWFIDEVSAKDKVGIAAIEDISNEAGISAYVKSTAAISLAKARAAFTRGVESETTDYIIGLVPIPGYSASYDSQLDATITWDAHVLVHKNGWILAYYPKNYYSARAINEKQQVVGGATKLSLAIDAVIAKTGGKFGAKSYYHFQFPDAQKMLVMYFKNGQDPRVKLPSSFTYYEKSLIIYTPGCCSSTFKIENTTVVYAYDGRFHYRDIGDLLTAGDYVQMYHEGNGASWGWGMIVILYSS